MLLRIGGALHATRPIDTERGVIWDAFAPPHQTEAFARLVMSSEDSDVQSGIDCCALSDDAPSWEPYSESACVVLRGDVHADNADRAIAIVGELSTKSDVWLATSGRKLTATIAARLHAVGLAGVAASFCSSSATAQDAEFGRKSWDDAATAIGLFQQLGLPTACLVHPTAKLIASRGLRDVHRLSKELGANWLVVSVSEAHSSVTADVQAFCAARSSHAAFSDYPGVSAVGYPVSHQHLLSRAFAATLMPIQPTFSPKKAPLPAEQPMTGMDLLDPPPGYRHRGAHSQNSVGGSVVDALSRARTPKDSAK